jgi:hypothetical protein
MGQFAAADFCRCCGIKGKGNGPIYLATGQKSWP